MSKIIKNTTNADIFITDVGQTILANNEVTVSPSEYSLFAESIDLLTFITSGDIVISDGSNDLNISDGIRLIQGSYPTEIALKSLTGDPVHITQNALNVHIDMMGLNPSENPNAAFPVQISNTQDMTNRLKTASSNRILEATWQYNKNVHNWSEKITGAGSIDSGGQTDPAYLKFTNGTTSNDKIEFQSKRYINYSPFRTHILTQACVLGDEITNVSKKFGQFTTYNGWFWEQNGSDFYVCLRNNSFEVSGTNETKVERANWNVDKFDGTGPSGLNLSSDFKNALTFVIEYAWHGTQGVKFGIQYFDRIYWAHFFRHSDTLTKPFSRSALLPIRYEMVNEGVPLSTPEWWIGPCSFNIEGGEEASGIEFGILSDDNGLSLKKQDGEVPILAIRPKLLINGIKNRGILVPNDFELISTDTVRYKVYQQVTFTGGTWNSVDPNSITEYSTDVTLSDFSGTYFNLRSGFVPAAANKTNSIFYSFKQGVAGFVDALENDAQKGIVITAKPLLNNTTSYAAFNWEEIY